MWPSMARIPPGLNSFSWPSRMFEVLKFGFIRSVICGDKNSNIKKQDIFKMRHRGTLDFKCYWVLLARVGRTSLLYCSFVLAEYNG